MPPKKKTTKDLNTKSLNHALPQAHPFDTLERRKKIIINGLPASRFHLEKMPEMKNPTPFQLASLAAAMPAKDTTQKRVLDAYELWEQSCKFLAPKIPPLASLEEVLKFSLPNKSKDQRIVLLRRLIESKAYYDSQKFLIKGKDRKALEQASADQMIEIYSTKGVEYPQELANAMSDFMEKEAYEKRKERGRKGGLAKREKQQVTVSPKKTKKPLASSL